MANDTIKTEAVYPEPAYPVATAVMKRISWGAVIAGLVVAMVVQLTLTILGLAIGAGTVNFQDGTAGSGLATGSAIWFVASALIALFAGGFVAGRLAGLPRREDSVLHGFLTWGAQTLVTFFLLTTAVGGLLSGTASMVGNVVGSAGQGLAQVIPDAMGGLDATPQQSTGQGQSGVNWDAIKSDAQSLATQGGQAGQAEELQRALGQVFNRPGGEAKPQDREALVGVVARYANIPRNQAEQRVTQWEQMYQNAQQQFQQVSAQAEQSVRQVADEAAGGISKAATWTFVALVLGAVAAASGGAAGRPKTLLTQTSTN